jgi:hypothetical protein
MNRFVPIVVLVAFLGVGCSGSVPGDTATDPAPSDAPADPVYTIDGNAVRIDEPGEDGTVSLLASTTGDLNDDGRDDRGVILRLDSKGSGVFYYLNVFLDEADDGWRLVGEEFLGDRIKFDFMDIFREGSVSSLTGVPIHPDDYGTLVAGFFIHGNQPIAEPPKLYLTRRWRVDEGKLVLMENH